LPATEQHAISAVEEYTIPYWISGDCGKCARQRTAGAGALPLSPVPPPGVGQYCAIVGAAEQDDLASLRIVGERVCVSDIESRALSRDGRVRRRKAHQGGEHCVERSRIEQWHCDPAGMVGRANVSSTLEGVEIALHRAMPR
jgi:hypothetical protein